MQPSTLIHLARRRSRLTLRALAARAGTSHSTLSAYETGATAPTAATLDRIVAAAGFAIEPTLVRRIDGDELGDRGDELSAVLDLASEFPARHHPHLRMPRFPPARR